MVTSRPRRSRTPTPSNAFISLADGLEAVGDSAGALVQLKQSVNVAIRTKQPSLEARKKLAALRRAMVRRPPPTPIPTQVGDSLARRTVWTYYESMAIPRIKATYSLDIDTMRVLERAAKRWGVSKSEALRRAVRAIATPGGPEPEATLDELQAAAGIATASANRWIRDLRTERQADRARPPKRSR